MKRQNDYFAARKPGSAYEYANLNGGFLGSLIEQASGQSLNAYMTEHVFAPLNVNGAYAATLLPDASQLSDTFEADGWCYATAENYLWDDGAYDDTCDPANHYRASVGSLYISAADLEKLGTVLAWGG